MTNHRKMNPALSIALLYLLAGFLWVLLSDAVVYHIPERHVRQMLQTSKGWLFVAVTSAFLYFLINRYLAQQEKSREELVAKEERLSLALASSRTGVWEWDLRTDRVIWSPEVYGIVGLPVFDGTFPSFAPLIHPDDLERVMATIQRALASKEDYSDEFRIVRPDTGEVRWLKNLGKGRYDTDGTPVILMGTVQDCTDQKRAKHEFEQFFNLIPDLACIASPDGYFLKVNRVWKTILGYSEEEVLAIPFMELIHPDDRQATAREVASHTEGRTVANFANRYRCRDGSYRWLEWTATPALEGRLIYATARDITDRKQAELQLMESEVRFSAIFHANPVACGLSRVDNKQLIDVNDAFLMLFGYERDEVIGRTSTDLGLCPYPEEEEAFYTLFAAQGRVNQFEAHFCHKSGLIGSLLISVEEIVLEGEEYLLGMLVDITDRKKAEQSLIESEMRFSTVFQANPVAIGISRYDDQRFVDVNESFLKLFGFTYGEVIGRTSLELDIWPDHAERLLLFALIEKYDRVSLFEASFRHKSGKIGSLLVSIEKIELGSEIYLVGMLVDITQRKESERSLQASEERYRAVVEDQTEVICRLSRDGKFLFANDAYCRLFGVSLKSLIGLSWRPVAHPDDLPSVESELSKMSAEFPVIVIENRVYNAKGELRWMQFVNRGFYNEAGELQEIQAVGRDITDRKQMETALRESEERYRRLFEVESDAVMVLDSTSGRFVDANSAALSLYGYTLQELHHLGPADLSAEPENTTEAINRNTGYVPLRYHRKKDGTVFPVEIAGSTFEYQGQTLHVAAIRDISERRQAEARLLELNSQLHTLSMHLQTVQEQERLAIARDIHDDIGQQLTALKLDVDWLEQQMLQGGGGLGSRIEGMRAGIDLLIARVQKIASELRPPLLDNLGLAAAIEWQVGEFTRRTGIECILMLNEDAEPVDPQIATSLVRIVQEALTNVSRHAQATEVGISLCRTGAGILLEVSDNGRGIREEDLTAPNSYGVLGMQERARLCGGALQITGVPGGGTRLRLSMPDNREREPHETDSDS